MRRRDAPYEFDALATYNAEVARGIVHTDEWRARMAAEQARFDAQFLAEAQAKGWLVVHEPSTKETK